MTLYFYRYLYVNVAIIVLLVYNYMICRAIYSLSVHADSLVGGDNHSVVNILN